MKKAVAVVPTQDVDVLISFYKHTFVTQGSIVPDEKLERMKVLVETLLKKKMAEMFFVKGIEECISYAIVFCFDAKRAYALFGAGNPEIDARYKGTVAYWEVFRYLAIHYGIREVDLEGVNSPQRGWFKLSFGGDLRPYFEIYKEKSYA